MNLVPTDLPEVLIIEPRVFGDGRGFFAETWNQAQFASAGLDVAFVQDNHSRSARGVLRGIHYQLTQPQGKLVRVVSGSVFDVAVDLRQSSPNFGRWTGVELSADSKRMLWIPPGFGHGFLTLADDTDFLYKCTAFYAPQDEQCIAWNDPVLGIEWPLDGIELILSDKDRHGLPFGEARHYP
jgi:dTDP-4-dehydrorhamnose 3,5-epimerase